MDLLWIKFPDMHPFSIGWRMGAGEDYKSKFWDWWDTAPENKDTESRLAFVKAHPTPPEWTHIALSMIWPERMVGDEFEFFFNDKTLPLRAALFAYGEPNGFASHDAWMKALDEAISKPDDAS